MRQAFECVALAVLFSGSCLGESLAAPDALERYLANQRDRQPGCPDLVFAVQIDASLPKLRKHGSMSGLKLVPKTGRIVYRGLRFTGDQLVKTAVIARFLANDAEPPEPAARTGLTRENYSFAYDRTSDYNGLTAYVFRLKPKRKSVGLFKGELWLDAANGAPLRLWGDFIKSPSIFVRSIRFVRDYQDLNQCYQPVRLLLTVETRLAGEAEMAVWTRPVAGSPAAGESGAGGAESLLGQGLGQ